MKNILFVSSVVALNAIFAQPSNATNYGDYSTGTITEFMTGDTMNIMSGSALIQTMTGGAITRIDANGIINLMQGGTIGSITTGGSVKDLNGGTITTLNGGSVTKISTGRIDTLTSGSVGDMFSTSSITNVNGGTINSMQNTSSITSMTAGTISAMINQSSITNMSGGTITSMAGGKIINMTGGTIAKMAGGTIENLGSGAVISSFESGLITGNVAAGQSIALAKGGRALFKATAPATAFGRNITTDTGAAVIIYDYDFNPGTIVTMVDNSQIILGNAALDNLTFNNRGALVVGSVASARSGETVTVNNLTTNGKINFVFFVDNAAGSNSDLLTLNNVSGSVLSHGLLIGNYNTGPGAKDKIDLIDDKSSKINLTLTNSRFVGLAARNYALESQPDGQGGLMWSLVLKEDMGFSDGALAIGSLPTANLIMSQNLAHSTFAHINEMRRQNTSGLWLKVIGNDAEFNTLAETNVRSYGIEGGFDFTPGTLWGGRMTGGVEFGYNMGDIETTAFNSSNNGGADSNVMYTTLYASFSQSAMYVDLMARYAFFNATPFFYDSADIKNELTVNQSGIGGAIAVGYQAAMNPRLILEPRAELSYLQLLGDDFTDPAGATGKYDASNSLLGSIGMGLKYRMGTFEPYARLSYLHEFSGKSDITYGDVTYTSDLGGGRGEVVVGIAGTASTSTQLLLEGLYQAGENSFRNLGIQFGLRSKF